MTSDEVVAAARETLGTPFRHQGRAIGVGLDCAGVAIYVASRLGFEPSDVIGYGETPANGQLERMIEEQGYLEEVDSRQPGDLLLMRILGEPQHVAICAGETMIHSYASVERCCEHDIGERWESRIVKVYRFIGVTL